MKSLIGNKNAEKDIRDWLAEQNFCGKSAQFTEIELHAIKRPGWLQVFRFEVRARDEHDEWHQFFGAMRADERYGDPQIILNTLLTERDAQLLKWSETLITRRIRKSG